MDRDIIRLETTDSTNRVALDAAEHGAVHGTAVIAGSQYAGRGRLGKVWISPPGSGLYCSVVVRPQLDAANYPQLSFVAGLAVAAVIDQMYGLDTGLKWPNDIYFATKKCGGILIESRPATAMSAVVGIGLNVNTEAAMFPDEICERATSLFLQSGRKVDIEALFIALREELLTHISWLETAGFAAIMKRWRQRDVFFGKRLEWLSVNGERVVGESLGPDDQGLLHVRSDDGTLHQILSGDVTLVP